MHEDSPDHAAGSAFEMDMHDADWARVYERQAARGELTERLCDLLDLSAGDRVLELGCGPGYTTEQLAATVAPGVVYAVDRSLGALGHLRKTVAHPTTRVVPIGGDVTALPVRFATPIPALLAFVLHHVETPEVGLAAIEAALPPDSPLLVVEYDPDEPGAVGPSLDHRHAPERVRTWLTHAGFEIDESVTLPEEAYAIGARATSGSA